MSIYALKFDEISHKLYHKNRIKLHDIKYNINICDMSNIQAFFEIIIIIFMNASLKNKELFFPQCKIRFFMIF